MYEYLGSRRSIHWNSARYDYQKQLANKQHRLEKLVVNIERNGGSERKGMKGMVHQREGPSRPVQR